MSLLSKLDLDKLTPARLWSELDVETKRLAARSLLDPAWDDAAGREEAIAAIASALRYRPASVRKLAADKRVEYLVRMVRANESLATSLLLALHLGRRTAMLAAFLDDLGIPQEDGVIRGEPDLGSTEPARFAEAIARLRERFPGEEVDTYLTTLVAMDAASWKGVADALRRERD